MLIIERFTDANAFLSNFFPCDVVFEGEIYPSVEHAFQAAKSLDDHTRWLIREARSPGQAKRMGRRVELRDDWEEIKLGVMATLLDSKFSDPSLSQRLMDTQDAFLIEGNEWGDTFWGVSYGDGSNHLGKLLMELRQELLKTA
jgi:ribA/ribD-fused uncharacterized protein